MAMVENVRGEPAGAATPRASEATLMRDVLFVVFKRKVPLIALFVIGSVIVGYGLVGEAQDYEASARVMVKRARQAYAMPAETSAVLKRGVVVNTELQIITSSTVAAEVVDRLGLAEGKDRGIVIAALQKQVKAKALPESDIIEISYRSKNPERAAVVVNAVLDAYLEVRKGIVVNFQAVRYLEGQAERARAARDSVAAEIAKLGAEKGELVQGLKGEMVMGLKNRLWNEQIALERSIEARVDELARVKKWLREGGDPSHVPTADIYEMGTVRAAHIKVIDNAAALAAARARYTPGHPEIERLERERESLVKLLREEVERAVQRQEMRLKEWQAEKRAVDEMLARLEARNADLATSMVKRRLLENELGVRADAYEMLRDRAEQYRVTAATDPSLQSVAVVSRASVPSQPTPQPVNMKVVVGVFTVVSGILMVFGLEKADHSLERREDVERYLGLKVLASIPERSGR